MSRPSNRPAWQATLSTYAEPTWSRGLLDLATSLLPYLALSFAMYLALRVSVLLTLALAIPAAGFLVRVFIIFHDCGHGSFLPSRRANSWVGKLTGLLVLAPFARWRHDHAVHHASSGDLDRRGVGDVMTLTIAEYEARSKRAQLEYRISRSPWVMFLIGPVVAMIIGPRIVAKDARPRMRNSVLATDAALLVVAAGFIWLMGVADFLLVWAPAAMMAGSAGIFLFYVQHQFEDAYWQSNDEWTYEEAALRGSSYLKLPKVLQFFSGNIGLHHVHHLNARIPNYNLQAAHDSTPVFGSVPTLTLRDAVRTVHLKLYDERTGKLVTFAQARVIAGSPARTPDLAAPPLQTAP